MLVGGRVSLISLLFRDKEARQCLETLKVDVSCNSVACMEQYQLSKHALGTVAVLRPSCTLRLRLRRMPGNLKDRPHTG